MLTDRHNQKILVDRLGPFIFNPKPSGFSLVELMVVMLIVGVVLSVAMPAFAIWIQNSKVRSGAESMLTGIQTARMEAVRRNAPVFFQLNPEADVLWTVGCVTVVAPPAETACPGEITRRTMTEGGLAGVLDIDPSDRRIVFDGFGRKVSPDELKTRITTKHTSISDSEIHPQRITVHQNGSTRMCDTKLSTTNLRGCRPED